MTAPGVSVIIPAYNYAQFLGETLKSVVAQTKSDWECVVVDDGSTDNTPDVAREWARRDSRIRYIRQENRGLAAARNSGVRASAGDALQFLDADDRLAPWKLKVQSRFLDERADVDVVYSPTAFFRTSDPNIILQSTHGKLSRPLMQKISGNAEALRKLQMFNIMTVLAPLVRRSVFDRVGGFNVSMRAVEDWDFWLRAAIAGCWFEFLPAGEPSGLIRVHEQSMSRSDERMVRGLIDGAKTFSSGPLPLVYEMATGIDDVEHGRRFQGVGHIARAARKATSFLTRARWAAYALSAVVLPRRAFLWVATRPMPERGLELWRKLGG
jgi:glycosyltransferase involved in cell wall biosynthesis